MVGRISAVSVISLCFVIRQVTVEQSGEGTGCRQFGERGEARRLDEAHYIAVDVARVGTGEGHGSQIVGFHIVGQGVTGIVAEERHDVTRVNVDLRRFIDYRIAFPSWNRSSSVDGIVNSIEGSQLLGNVDGNGSVDKGFQREGRGAVVVVGAGHIVEFVGQKGSAEFEVPAAEGYLGVIQRTGGQGTVESNFPVFHVHIGRGDLCVVVVQRSLIVVVVRSGYKRDVEFDESSSLLQGKVFHAVGAGSDEGAVFPDDTGFSGCEAADKFITTDGIAGADESCRQFKGAGGSVTGAGIFQRAFERSFFRAASAGDFFQFAIDGTVFTGDDQIVPGFK